jgi:DNA (cytosine-5)-methyltransferase 1
MADQFHTDAGVGTRRERSELTFIDLFCGCGGFTLGMLRAGFRCLAAVDFNQTAVEVLRTNLAEKRRHKLPAVDHVLERDLTRFQPQELAAIIGCDHVDVIVGGPPCQGYSLARQVDGANHGARFIEDDERRNLYQDLLRFVEHFQPKIFVMENVLGLRSTADGGYFTRVQKEARELGRKSGRTGYRVHDQIEDAWELGAPQKRRRQLIVGVHGDLPGYFLPTLRPARRAVPKIALGECIADLPGLRAGNGNHERDYDLKRRSKQMKRLGKPARRYLSHVLQVGQASKLTNHTARSHSDRDLRDFRRLKEGESSARAMRRGVRFEFPYSKDSFKDRYTRQSRFEPCSTIVAHMSKDGLMFIHPTQNRSLTPREAARVQSFPDWFVFPKARTRAFALIGNAVPPLVAEATGNALKKYLSAGDTTGARPKDAAEQSSTLDRTTDEALQTLRQFASMTPPELKALTRGEFLRCWRALLHLVPALHPRNALDHGESEEPWPDAGSILPKLPPSASRRYVRSGWPVALVPIGREAWRRVRVHKLSVHAIHGIGGSRRPRKRSRSDS